MTCTCPTVTLNWGELAYAWDLAKWRVFTAQTRHLQDQAGATSSTADRWALHLNGAVGECAWAVYLGLDLPAYVDTFHKEPDLPPDVEVRWSSRPGGDLVIRRADKGKRRYCLVTGYAPTFTLHGWLWREEVQDCWVRDPGGHGPAWFIPHDSLHPAPPRGIHLGRNHR